MARRKILYVSVITLILLCVIIYFIIFIPRDHVYNGTLATNPSIVYQIERC